MRRKEMFIGTSRDLDVFLIYEQDMTQLKDMALNIEFCQLPFEIYQRAQGK